DVAGDCLPVRRDACAALVQAVPVGEVGPPEGLAVAADPGEAGDHLPVGGGRRQRDDLPVIEDDGLARQRDRGTGHSGKLPPRATRVVPAEVARAHHELRVASGSAGGMTGLPASTVRHPAVLSIRRSPARDAPPSYGAITGRNTSPSRSASSRRP